MSLYTLRFTDHVPHLFGGLLPTIERVVVPTRRYRGKAVRERAYWSVSWLGRGFGVSFSPDKKVSK